MRFRTKLSLVFMGLILAVTIPVYVLVHTSSMKMMEKEISEVYEDRIAQILDTLDGYLYERLADIQVIARDPVISSGRSTEKERTGRLKEYEKYLRSYLSFSIFDTNRVRIIDTSGLEIGKQHPSRDFFEKMAVGAPYNVDIYPSISLKRIIVRFAAPIRDRSGGLTGYIVARIPVERLHEIIVPATLTAPEARRTRMDLIDRNGVVLYSSHMGSIPLEDQIPYWKEIEGRLTTRKQGNFRFTDQDGTDFLYYYAREQGYLDFSGSSWFLIARIPARIALASLHTTRDALSLMILPILALGLILAYFVSRTVSRPVETLRRATALIGEGNLDSRVAIGTHDEIGELAGAFNAMTIHLKKTFTKLEDTQKDLEAAALLLENKVTRRTEELYDTQKALLNLMEDLEIEKSKFEMLAQNVPFGITLIDRAGEFVYMNRWFREFFGQDEKETGNKERWFREFVPIRADQTLLLSAFDGTAEATPVAADAPPSIRVRSANGAERVVSFFVVPLIGGETIIAFLDITDQKAMETALKDSEYKFKGLVEESIVGVYIAQDGLFRYANRRFAEIHGYTQEEMIDRLGPKDLIPSDDWEAFQRALKSATPDSSEPANFTQKIRRKDGKIIHVEIYGSSMVFGGRPAAIGTLLDVTERVQAEETVKYLAFHDTLTGLPNRALFNDRLSQAVAIAKRTGTQIAVLFLDLDGFKDINDSYGHSVGDRLLQEVSVRLKEHLRQGDTVSRFGGDEFAILACDIKRSGDASVVAEKVVASFSAPFELNGITVEITTSIGIALYPDHGDLTEDLLKRADIAMYRAKAAGRNRVANYGE